jgi:hypothetical protein
MRSPGCHPGIDLVGAINRGRRSMVISAARRRATLTSPTLRFTIVWLQPNLRPISAELKPASRWTIAVRWSGLESFWKRPEAGYTAFMAPRPWPDVLPEGRWAVEYWEERFAETEDPPETLLQRAREHRGKAEAAELEVSREVQLALAERFELAATVRLERPDD